MRLTRLEMQGFKSFADETSMLFDDGVTAIVGPNGCGKSNVSDAVRWVLGEQRARILRGAKMEEVIFQGSSARRAVNVSEVSLVFANDDGVLPTPFREVVVTRRLSRSGESEYLLNGSPCRLRDIHDMMRGTGLGADAGVVIEQRMIDALLSDRPDDRRELFEEAAGIGLYRDRRRNTERRLDETTQDLARLDDLLGEVQSQVRSLSRQRKRAERHAELMTRRFAVDLTLASRDMASWREELAQLEVRVRDLRENMPLHEERVRQAEGARDESHRVRSSSDAHRNEVSRQAGAVREAVQALRSEIAVASERHRNAMERRQRAEDERRDGNEAENRLDSELAAAAAECGELDRSMIAAREESEARTAAETEAREAVRIAREGAETSERMSRQARDQMRTLVADREAALRELNELETRTRALDAERGQLNEAAEVLAREIGSAQATAMSARERVEHTQSALDQARLDALTAREQDAAARVELGRIEDLYTAMEGRVHGLEGLERERVGLAPAAAKLLEARDRFGPDAILGPLSDFVSANANAAAEIERFLGMSVHAVLVRDRVVADAIREWHAETGPGPLLLLPLDAVSVIPRVEPGELIEQLDVAPEARAWARVLLERVKSLEDGSFIDRRGAVWLPGPSAGPGPLRRRAELSSLRAELDTAGEARRAAITAAEVARTRLQDAEVAVVDAADASHAAHNVERHAREALAELERRHGRYQRELHESRTQSAQLSGRIEVLESDLRTIDDSQSHARDEAANHDARANQHRDGLVSAEARMDAARDRRTDGQVALAQAQARLQVAMDRQQRLRSERDAAATRVAALATELTVIEEADRALAAQMDAWQQDLETRVASLSDAESRLDAAERAVTEANERAEQAEHALDAARVTAHDQGEELHNAQLRFTELSGRRTAIRERLEAEWRRPLDELMSTVQPLDLDDDALRAEAVALQQQVDALGPVNPLAIEEHDDEVKRYDFLSTQRADLSEARNSLQTAIREIDATARDMFMATFTQVRENFRHIFMTLFGGGECDLRLENPELPLDCDIEVHASPRGKRTQRIHLLSSGERALVALSLLFGIFLTKPSPFCLLDEVDAPLDDANIGRFVRMLNEFKAKTQFIVFTHNPRTTTEAADAVYGITMQEPGVSSVVSVRMRGPNLDDTVHDEDEAAVDTAIAVEPPPPEAVATSL
ncbi:MAG TPA: AAA family ATPase [Gemmatimonadaceae bacterium]|nr:AAA family ATPase [Gemmatimonadaceae bacterium]